MLCSLFVMCVLLTHYFPLKLVYLDSSYWSSMLFYTLCLNYIKRMLKMYLIVFLIEWFFNQY